MDSGIIKIDGELLWHEEVNGKLAKASQKHLRKVRSNLGIVFQLFNLFPHINILKNITIAPRFVLNLSQQEAEERAKELLKMVGLLDKMKSYPAELSGGQRQRVAIARALAMRPKIMLFDEITSALDPELIAEVLNILRKLAKETQMTMIIVTHEILFAKEIADEIAFIDEGKVLEKGPPDEILLSPSHSRTREFLRTVVEKR